MLKAIKIPDIPKKHRGLREKIYPTHNFMCGVYEKVKPVAEEPRGAGTRRTRRSRTQAGRR